MKKPLRSLLMGSSILLVGIGGLASAESPGPGEGPQKPHKMPFEEMDQNKDGKLTLEEHRQFHEEKSKRWFQDMDENKDGAVTKEEIQTAHQRRGPKKFEDLDTNKDGQISQQEFEAGKPKRPANP